MLKATLRYHLRLETNGFGKEHWDGEFSVEVGYDKPKDLADITQAFSDFIKEKPVATAIEG